MSAERNYIFRLVAARPRADRARFTCWKDCSFDRFLDSSAIYQGIARAIDAEQVKVINEFAVGLTKPDLTILIDLSEVGLARVRARSNGEFDRMEQESLNFSNQFVLISDLLWPNRRDSCLRRKSKRGGIV